MVTQRSSDAAESATPIAPVAKRKRRASCLGEQERRERKRAIDREAQRSLREKTKTHIAELERTIQILRDQDRNGATANLLSEIDSLRAENERLRDIIDSVKSVLGNDVAPRSNAAPEPSTSNGGAIASPASSSNGHRSPKPRTVSFVDDNKPSLPTPTDIPTSYDFSERTANTRLLDLDGMNMMVNVHSSSTLGMDLDTEPVEEIRPSETVMVMRRSQVDPQDWENNAATASWGPLMQEVCDLCSSATAGAVHPRPFFTSAPQAPRSPRHPSPYARSGGNRTRSSRRSTATTRQQAHSRSLSTERSYQPQPKPGSYISASKKAGPTYPTPGRRAPRSSSSSKSTSFYSATSPS
ncbi:hypothetical protein OPT61_g9369 [Boeremia exigua]|uniref:Uncharacterized protein n=1 Tax=Boeremia exigua TaxID=749465 RepID=A0ACC2HUZ1_9PLEO|nr:hypothetical protein OPT61_g9369 [Boeremia exigua]